MKRPLSPRPSLNQLKNQAKDLLKAHRAGDSDAIQRIAESHPRLSGAAESEIRASRFTLSGAQLVVAREYGFASWPKPKEHVESTATDAVDPAEAFRKAPA